MASTVIIHGAKIPHTTHSPKHGRPGAVLWGCTRANVKYWQGQLKDWDAWFDMHPLVATGQFKGIPERRPDTWKWYLRQDGTRPIYLQDPRAHIHGRELAEARFHAVPGARPFPIAVVQHRLLVRERWRQPAEPNRYFFCQVGMMIALACVQGFDTIVLNGIGQPTNVAHQHLHRDIGYWIGFARGQGRDVLIDGTSTFLMPEKLYAYETFGYGELAQARAEGLQ